MKETFIYIAEMMLCSGVLMLMYRILLDGRVGLGVCRTYLLLSMVISAVIPALRIPVYAGDVVYYTPEPLADIDLFSQVVATPPQSTVDLPLVIYCCVAGLAFVLTLVNIWRIFAYRRGAQITRTQFYLLIESGRIKSPFSFFRNIFVCNGLSRREMSQVLAHEISHIRHHHSVELLVAEIIKNLLWFNPFVWIMKRSLVEVHEYQADRDVLQLGFDVDNYRILIFKQLFGYNPDMTSGLNHSLTKKRFIMMTRKIRGRFTIIKLATIVPVLGALMMLFSFTKQATLYVEKAPKQKTESKSEAKEPRIAVDSVDTTPVNLDVTWVSPNATSCVVNGNINLDVMKFSPNETVYVVNGEVVEDVSNINVNTISSLVVKTDDETLKKYGKEGTTSVRMITCRPMTMNVNMKVLKYGKDQLVVVDGIQSSAEAYSKMNPDDITNITRLNSDVAMSLFGEKGKNGAIVITTKGRTSTDATDGALRGTITSIKIRDVNGSEVKNASGKKPLVIVDDLEVPYEDLKTISSADIHNIEVRKDSASNVYGEKGAYGVILITTNKRAKELGTYKSHGEVAVSSKKDSSAVDTTEQEDAFIVVEQMPTFLGGDMLKFRQWVMECIKYPADHNLSGRVLVGFVIEKDGSLSNINVIKSPHPQLSDEVIRVLKDSPKWIPGVQKGQKKRVKYVLPVDFNNPGVGDKK